MSESTNSTPVFKEEYQKQIADIYKQYQQTVKPYVAQLEVMENEFPIEILNEVRAIMSHIAKCYEITNEELIQKNIGKAKSHMKRCVLDCYKYLCLAYSDYYENFVHKYRFTDLTVVDNGEFWSDLCETVSKAKKQLILAKQKEGMVEDVEDAYNEFEAAYNQYHRVYEIIENSKKDVLEGSNFRFSLDNPSCSFNCVILSRIRIWKALSLKTVVLFILFFKEKRMETFEMPFKLGNDAKAALVGEICTCRL